VKARHKNDTTFVTLENYDGHDIGIALYNTDFYFDAGGALNYVPWYVHIDGEKVEGLGMGAGHWTPSATLPCLLGWRWEEMEDLAVPIGARDSIMHGKAQWRGPDDQLIYVRYSIGLDASFVKPKIRWWLASSLARSFLVPPMEQENEVLGRACEWYWTVRRKEGYVEDLIEAECKRRRIKDTDTYTRAVEYMGGDRARSGDFPFRDCPTRDLDREFVTFEIFANFDCKGSLNVPGRGPTKAMPWEFFDIPRHLWVKRLQLVPLHPVDYEVWGGWRQEREVSHFYEEAYLQFG